MIYAGKISVSEHNRIIGYVKEAHAEYQSAKADAEKVQNYEVLPDCPECNGTGVEEIGIGDPAHNPTGAACYGKCKACKGKGYV